jgi:hypothetical protein
MEQELFTSKYPNIHHWSEETVEKEQTNKQRREKQRE